jgi:metallo-beta-lactamase family protein
MELEFYGAAGEVTGSCHILRIGASTVLLDCGMVQGSRRAEARNRDPFPFEPREIAAVALSHAHVDHSGRLPLLVKQGYAGVIHAQEATKALCGIMLSDAADLSERDAELENRKRKRKDLPLVEPLYRIGDAQQASRQVFGMRYGAPREIAPGVEVRLHDAGHIMGSAIVEARLREDDRQVTLVFSGDLGQYGTPILRDPTGIEHADLLLMECTYGDRLHRDRQRTVAEIADILETADAKKGNVLIPAFAVGRSQEILYLLGKHYEEWNLHKWRIFLDSPMAIAASEIYWEHPQLYDQEALRLRSSGEAMRFLPNLTLSRAPRDSMRINEISSGAIIIAGSGMCTGGRILHHFKHNLWRPECHVLIVGYQAHGTLGRRLVDGADYVRVHHETIRVRARIHTVGGLSAHADRDDLLRWYKEFSRPPPVYLVHGEHDAAEAFKARLEQAGAPAVTVAAAGMRLSL